MEEPEILLLGLHCFLFLLTLLSWLIICIYISTHPLSHKAWKMETFAHATIARLCISSESAVDSEYRKLQNVLHLLMQKCGLRTIILFACCYYQLLLLFLGLFSPSLAPV